jgi:ribokinase
MASSPCVLVVGDINIDVIINGTAYPAEGDEVIVKQSNHRLGGSGCNTAVVFSKLGANAQILGHIGKDPFGTLARTFLQESGVDTRWMVESSLNTTGWMMILVTNGGQRTMFGCRGCNELPFPNPVVSPLLESLDLLHVSGYSFIEDDQWAFVHKMMEEAHAKGVKVSLDPGAESIKRVRERVLSALPCVDYLLLSEFELDKLVPRPWLPNSCEELLAYGVGSVILKKGEKGSALFCRNKEASKPACDVPGLKVLNTTGAGDCFNAGFLLGQLQGLSPAASLTLGNAAAYCAITSPNGMEDMRHESSLPDCIAKIICSGKAARGDTSIRQALSVLKSA